MCIHRETQICTDTDTCTDTGTQRHLHTDIYTDTLSDTDTYTDLDTHTQVCKYAHTHTMVTLYLLSESTGRIVVVHLTLGQVHV